jgi:hypothetical protein
MAYAQIQSAYASMPFRCRKCSCEASEFVLWPLVFLALAPLPCLMCSGVALHIPWRPLRVAVFALWATIGFLLFTVTLLLAVGLKVMVRLFFLFKRCPACGSRTMTISNHYGLGMIPKMFGSLSDGVRQVGDEQL